MKSTRWPPLHAQMSSCGACGGDVARSGGLSVTRAAEGPGVGCAVTGSSCDGARLRLNGIVWTVFAESAKSGVAGSDCTAVSFASGCTAVSVSCTVLICRGGDCAPGQNSWWNAAIAVNATATKDAPKVVLAAFIKCQLVKLHSRARCALLSRQ